MPTSKTAIFAKIKMKGSNMSEAKPVETKEESPAMTTEDFQNFVATLNAGLFALVKPVKAKTDDLDKVKADKIEVDKLIAKVQTLSKDLEITTDNAGQTSLDLQKVISSIPNILEDVKTLAKLIQELFEVLQPILAIFKADSLKVSATKYETLGPKFKACLAGLEKPKTIVVESTKVNPATTPAPANREVKK